MVSHFHKCIFIHIPKTAGTSLWGIVNASQDNNKTDQLLLSFKPDDYKFDPPPPHLRASDYIKYDRVPKELFDSYFKFAFVRNPWDRLVSEYRYRMHAHEYSFKEFLFEHFPKPSWNDEYCHVIPQYDFLHDEKGNLLVDFVGRFETLQEDFFYVCEKLNIKKRVLLHRNKSTSIFNRRDNRPMKMLRSTRDKLSINYRRNTFKKFTDYYDAESIDFVAKIYKKDIETFGYKFEDK
ncbi:sulfotransferase family protein [Desulfogranum marinum]|uniref:sulfotransferase family protein n=1 Tax=Desulfogranum marinum TaxID=453220 RepID=UPI0019643615|nr:sulfotransferase family protein [Desulfogranum marinum]MBM9514826.1 sulfotransferase family 2 domain-containing protein [Desulfogranum marinum]